MIPTMVVKSSENEPYLHIQKLFLQMCQVLGKSCIFECNP